MKTARNKRMDKVKKFTMHMLAAASAVTVCVMLAVGYSYKLNPVEHPLFANVGLVFPIFLLINGGFLVLFLLTWKRLTLIPLAGYVLCYIPAHFYSPLNMLHSTPDGAIKVMSYNVWGYGTDKNVDGTNIVVQYIADSDADIVCLQEVNLPGEYDVARFFEKRFPGYHVGYFMFVTDKGSYGNVTLSKFPILNKGKLMFDKSSNLAIFTDLKIGEGAEIRVYNCHFESYNVSLSRLKKSVADKDGELMWETEEKMKKSIRRRPEQVDKVMSDIEDCTLEAIVTGDFNDNPMSYTYNRLKKGRDDSFVEAGKGFGATYSFLWPFIRIDYILYPSHFTAVSHSVPRIRYSDHYPVIAEINLK